MVNGQLLAIILFLYVFDRILNFDLFFNCENIVFFLILIKLIKLMKIIKVITDRINKIRKSGALL